MAAKPAGPPPDNDVGRARFVEAVPHAFSLDAEGKILLAAGLESGRLAAYRIDAGTGTLRPLKIYPVGTRPMWVLITRLAG